MPSAHTFPLPHPHIFSCLRSGFPPYFPGLYPQLRPELRRRRRRGTGAFDASTSTNSLQGTVENPISVYLLLEQTGNLSCLIHVNPLCSRYLRQSRHGHDLSCKRYDKTGSRGDLQVPHRYLKVCGRSQLSLVVCQGSTGSSLRRSGSSRIREPPAPSPASGRWLSVPLSCLRRSSVRSGSAYPLCFPPAHSCM